MKHAVELDEQDIKKAIAAYVRTELGVTADEGEVTLNYDRGQGELGNGRGYTALVNVPKPVGKQTIQQYHTRHGIHEGRHEPG